MEMRAENIALVYRVCRLEGGFDMFVGTKFANLPFGCPGSSVYAAEQIWTLACFQKLECQLSFWSFILL